MGPVDQFGNNTITLGDRVSAYESGETQTFSSQQQLISGEGDQGWNALKVNSSNTLVTILLPSWLHESCLFLGFPTGFARVCGSSDPKISKLYIL